MITKESLSLKIHMCGLKSSHIVKYSCNLIKPTQASQWINFMHNGVGLGKAAMVMMWNMCQMLELEKSSGETKLVSRGDEYGLKSIDGVELHFDGVSSDEEEKGLLPVITIENNVNSFLTKDKINVMAGSFIKKSNGHYFNYDGSVYFNDTFDEECRFEKDGKVVGLRIGSGTFGKYEIIS